MKEHHLIIYKYDSPFHQEGTTFQVHKAPPKNEEKKHLPRT